MTQRPGISPSQPSQPKPSNLGCHAIQKNSGKEKLITKPDQELLNLVMTFKLNKSSSWVSLKMVPPVLAWPSFFREMIHQSAMAKESSAPGSAKGQATHDHQADHGCRQHHLTLPRPGVGVPHLGSPGSFDLRKR